MPKDPADTTLMVQVTTTDGTFLVPFPMDHRQVEEILANDFEGARVEAYDLKAV